MCACRRLDLSSSGAINTCCDIEASRFPQNGHVYVEGFEFCAPRIDHHLACSAIP
jgi:hypothetical protein